VVVLEQRRPSEADERYVRQCQPHVAREFSPLGTVSLVRDDDDIVPFAIWPGNILVEFVNQAEDKPMILSEQRLQVLARLASWRLFIRHAAADEGTKDLIVKILTVRHDGKRKVSGNDATDFLSKKGH
jgi:hypothetical protein